MNVVGIKIFEDTNTILRNRLRNGTRKKDWSHWISGIKWCSPRKLCLLLFQRKGHSCVCYAYTLVANEVTNKVLIVMNISKGTINGINVRDDHDKYTLRFRASDYYTYKTSISLHEYIVQKVKYLKTALRREQPFVKSSWNIWRHHFCLFLSFIL